MCVQVTWVMMIFMMCVTFHLYQVTTHKLLTSGVCAMWGHAATAQGEGGIIDLTLTVCLFEIE